MANLSDASVEIEVTHVGREFINYAKLAERNEYQIIDYIEESLNPDGNGDVQMSGSASGRWAYASNIEGYFDPKQVKSWLGVGSDRSWMPESKREEAKQQSETIYEAYEDLCKAIIETDGTVTIRYTDMEGGNQFIEKGTAVLSSELGEIQLTLETEESEYTVENYMDISGENLSDAIMTLHGDEAMDAYYLARPSNARTAADFDIWYEDYEG